MKVFVGIFILTFSFITNEVVCQAQDLFEDIPIAGSLSTSTTSNFSQRHRKVYTDLDASGSYLWTDEIQTSLSLGLVKSFTQKMELLFKDLVLETAHNKLYVHPKTDITLRGYGKLFFPTSRESINRSQITVVKLGTGLSKNIDKFNLGYDLSGSYFLNRFATAKNGSSNQHYGIANTAIIGYQFTKEFSVNTTWSLLNFATYANTPRASYSFVQEASYQITPEASVSLGLSTGGRQYKKNGKELNLSIFDEKSSEIFLGVGYEL